MNPRRFKVTAQINQQTHQLATFAYHSSGRLVSQTDTVTGLVTGYGWDGTSSRLASVTPPGQAPISYLYNSAGKLATVTRPVPQEAGGGRDRATGLDPLRDRPR